MKRIKIVTALVCIIMTLTVTGCNKTILDTTYTFDEAIICVGGEWMTVKVTEWTDYDDGDQIQIKAEDGTIYLVHASNCTLISHEGDS